MTTKTLTAAGLLILALVSTAQSADVLRTLSWSELKASGQLAAGEILPPEPPEKGEILRIENAKDEPRQIALLEIDDPGVTRSVYAIRGRVRYENVKGEGYLEMWNYFPDGSRYFSRTLDGRGLLKSLKGRSAWRDFALPFSITQGNTRPNRLVVNVVFQGRGIVYLGPLELAEYDSLAQALRVPGAWWNDPTGGWIGGLGGMLLGCLGGFIGILAGRGRARRLVMAVTAAMVLLGVVFLAAGLTALALGQPYGVWYVLMLPGIILIIVCAPLGPILRRRYAQLELARISAADLGHAAR